MTKTKEQLEKEIEKLTRNMKIYKEKVKKEPKKKIKKSKSKKKKVDKKELKPVMVEHLDIVSPNIDFGSDDSVFIDKSKTRDEADNFFRAVVNNLMSDENISLKTEYLSPNENFAGAKLEFLAKYGNMPYLKDFIRILEIKRVSLGRKSRIELIKAFEKRDEEIQAQNRISMIRNISGMG